MLDASADARSIQGQCPLLSLFFCVQTLEVNCQWSTRIGGRPTANVTSALRVAAVFISEMTVALLTFRATSGGFIAWRQTLIVMFSRASGCFIGYFRVTRFLFLLLNFCIA